MDIQAEKIELAKRILDTEDEALIREIKLLVESHAYVFHEDLPEYVKEGVEKSRQQAAEGLLVSHNEVLQRLKRFQRNK